MLPPDSKDRLSLTFCPRLFSRWQTRLTENVQVKVDWIDRVIGRILKARDHHKLIKFINSMRARMRTCKDNWM